MPKNVRFTDDEDTEGQGGKAKVLGDDEDTEGQGGKAKSLPEDDTEGHVMLRKAVADDEEIGPAGINRPR